MMMIISKIWFYTFIVHGATFHNNEANNELWITDAFFHPKRFSKYNAKLFSIDENIAYVPFRCWTRQWTMRDHRLAYVCFMLNIVMRVHFYKTSCILMPLKKFQGRDGTWTCATVTYFLALYTISREFSGCVMGDMAFIKPANRGRHTVVWLLTVTSLI